MVTSLNLYFLKASQTIPGHYCPGEILVRNNNFQGMATAWSYVLLPIDVCGSYLILHLPEASVIQGSGLPHHCCGAGSSSQQVCYMGGWGGWEETSGFYLSGGRELCLRTLEFW